MIHHGDALRSNALTVISITNAIEKSNHAVLPALMSVQSFSGHCFGWTK
jgi:hypothetical protein